VLTCRAHQWSFDACSGGSINPSGACLRRFALRVENGSVWVADRPCDE
jgi:toluene monooxygenase system ferredoxin subunit